MPFAMTVVPVLLIAVGLVGWSVSSPAATGAFSLSRLRLNDAAGAENYVFTVGDVVYPDGGVDSGAYYRFVVTDASGIVRNPASACASAAAFTRTNNTYTVQANDSPSTNTPWKFTLQQFTNATCTGTAAKTSAKKFFVVKAAAYADATLATPKASFGQNGTAYLAVSGLKPGANDWSATWIGPSGATACANTAGSDRPDASSSGRLPGAADYLQYRPVASTTGSAWNREANYETKPCPSFSSANEGGWKLRLALDATNFVVVSAFSVDTTLPPAPAVTGGPSSPTNSSSASFAFSDSESGVSFLCRVDGAAFATCTSPQSYSGLAEGNHSFEVKARDAAANESAVASGSWTVDISAPIVKLTSPVDGSSTSNTTPTFSGSAGSASGDSAIVTIRIYSGSSVAGSPVQTLAASRQLDGSFSEDASPELSGGTYTVQAEQSDAAGNVGRSSAHTFTVGPGVLPANTTPPTISGATQVGQTLSAEAGTWSGTQPLSYAYQWRRCDEGGTACADIFAATAPSYTLTAADIGFTIGVSVTASNAAGSATAASVATAVVSERSGCSPRSSSYSGAVLGTVGVVGYWRLGDASGTVACDSKGANNGSYQPGTTLGQTGGLAGDADTAVAFDGSSGWVQVPHAPSLDVGDRFTVEAWVKRGSINGTANHVIASKQSGAWVLMFNPSNELVLRQSGVADLVSSTTNVTDTNRWHYVAATKDGAAVKLYLDGQEVTGAIVNKTISDNTLPLAIGQSASTSYFNGTIDEVVLYNVALSGSQLASHYTAGLPPAQAPANSSPPTISGTAQVGQTLRSDPGTWSGTQSIGYAYQWRRCDQAGGGCGDIGGASGASYTLGSADAGSTVRVQVTASNNVGSASASSAASAVVTAGCAPRSSSYSAAVLATSGLVGYWRLGESTGTVACDSNGANNGSYRTGTTLGQPGGLAGDADTAVAFDGSSGWVQVPDAPSLDVGDRFTVEAWVRRGSINGTANQVIASKQSGAWVLMFDSSNQLVLRKSGVANLAISTTAVTDTTKWHHVVATKDGAKVKLYLDGVDVTGPVTNETMSDNLEPLTIGESSTIAYFNGTIDELALYNVEVSAAQVASHYAAGASAPSSDPIIAAAGDIACDPTATSFNGGHGTAAECRQQYTSDLLVGQNFVAVLALGDNQYTCGGYNAFLQSYGPSWGRVKSITHPVLGNHEYQTSGGTNCDPTGSAAGYFQYFGAAAGDVGRGYYSFDIGTWHLVALNSNCSQVGGCAAGSPEETWLRADLATHSSFCTLAYWHHPRFTSGAVGNDANVAAFWQDLYAAGADIVLNGHAHGYERFALQGASGNSDPARGLREFVVGTGGEDFHPFTTSQPLSEVREDDTFGVLTLTLHPGSYDWRFVPEAGRTFTDSGSTTCH